MLQFENIPAQKAQYDTIYKCVFESALHSVDKLTNRIRIRKPISQESLTVFEPESGDESTTTSNFLLLRGDLYLGSATSKMMPYIGAHPGQSSYTFESGGNEDSGSTGAYGWHGGLKIFATENTSWNFEINSTTYTPDVDEGQEEIDYTNTQFLLGFSYYF